jgi:hypothetical protein
MGDRRKIFSVRRLCIYGACAIAADWLGLLGASATNPGTGWLLHSEALWRVFGVLTYLGAAVLPVLVIIALGRAVRLYVVRRRPGPSASR